MTDQASQSPDACDESTFKCVDAKPFVISSGMHLKETLRTPKKLQICVCIASPTKTTYVVHYGAGPSNGLCTWTQEDGCRTRNRRQKLQYRILRMVYVTQSYSMFAFCQDMTVRTFGSQFREQSSLKVHNSMLSMVYDECTNSVFTGSIGQVEKWRLDAHLHQSPSVVKVAYLRDQFASITPFTFLALVEGKQQLLVLSGNIVFFLDTITLEVLRSMYNRNRLPMTACLAYIPRQYFITGSENGEMSIWNLSMKTFPYVSSFVGHVGRIVSLIIHPKEDLLISASEDSTIRLWRMETLQETYRYDVLERIYSAYLVTPNLLCYTSDRQACLLEINLCHALFTLLGSTVTELTRPQNGRILVACHDGGVRVLSEDSGCIISTLLPTITHRVISYTYERLEQKMYVLLDNHSIMVITTKTNPCSILQLIVPSNENDLITCLGVVYLTVNNKEVFLLLAAYNDGRIVQLKSSKGVHLASVTGSHGLITTLKQCHGSSTFDFLTSNREHYVTAWKISLDKKTSRLAITAADTLAVGREVEMMVSVRNTVVVTHGRNMRVYQIAEENKHVLLSPSIDDKHRSRINGLTSCESLHLFASLSSHEGRVKVWNDDYHLVMELSFGMCDPGLCFAGPRGDLLFGFQSNIHRVRAEDYLPQKYVQRHTYSKQCDERGLEFDSHIQFWYDPIRVPCVTDKQFTQIKIHSAKSEQSSAKIKQEILRSSLHLKVSPLPILNNSLLLGSNSSRRKSITKNFKNIQPVMKSLTPKRSASRADVKKSGSSTNSTPFVENRASMEQLERSTSLPAVRKYWPCAPDGYMPNSCVRYTCQPAEPKFVPDPWKPRVFENSNDLLMNFKDDFLGESKSWLDEKNEEENLFTTPERDVVSKVDQTVQDTKNNSLNVEKKVHKKVKPVKKTKKISFEKTPFKGVASVGFEETLEEEEEEVFTENVDCGREEVTSVIGPIFDKYLNKGWFPEDMQFDDPEKAIRHLLEQLDPVQPFKMKDIMHAIVDIHKHVPMSEQLYSHVVDTLTPDLKHRSAQVRNYVVSVLGMLGHQSNDVIAQLIPMLSDGTQAVREEVKRTLQQLAGIKNADTLYSWLMERDHVRAVETEMDILARYKERLIVKREAVRERVQKIREQEEKKVSPWLLAAFLTTKKQKRKTSGDEKCRRIKKSLSKKEFDMLEKVVETWKTTEDEESKTKKKEKVYSFREVGNEVLEDAEKPIKDDNNDVKDDINNDVNNENGSGESRDNLATEERSLPDLDVWHLNKLTNRECPEGTVNKILLTIAPQLFTTFSSLVAASWFLSANPGSFLTRSRNALKANLKLKPKQEEENIQQQTGGKNATIRLANFKSFIEYKSENNGHLENGYNNSVKNVKTKTKKSGQASVSNQRTIERQMTRLVLALLRESRCSSDEINSQNLAQKFSELATRLHSEVDQTWIETLFDTCNNGRTENICEEETLSRMKLISSPIERSMVPGIKGERVLSELRVRPRNTRKIKVIKSIPERHGTETVANISGITDYGTMGLKWTTFAPAYDDVADLRPLHQVPPGHRFMTDTPTSLYYNAPNTPVAYAKRDKNKNKYFLPAIKANAPTNH